VDSLGSYALLIETPEPAETIVSLACNLRLVLIDDAGRRSTHLVHSLERAGSYQRIAMWYSKPMNIPSGNYVVGLANDGSTLFADRGAMVTLERDRQHPTETYVRRVLVRGLGWLALITGSVLGLMATVLRPRGAS